jgi:biotin synthase
MTETYTYQPITRDEACAIGSLPVGELPALFSRASATRRVHHGDMVFTCAIMNAKSGNCSEDCAFCAQSSRHKSPSPRYPLLPREELVTEGLRQNDNGITRFAFVTSGHGLTDIDIDTICEAARQIRARTGMKLCASLGILDHTRGKRLKESGISRYHHNIETARSYYPAICSTHSFEDRIHTITEMKSAGLELCSCGILGMGESWEQRVEMAFTLRDLAVDSVPINFLNPIEGTRFETLPRMNPMDALRSLAMFRLVHPDRDITVCGGREPTLGDYQSWIFLAGANGVMVGNYLTLAGRDLDADMKMIRDMGLANER